MIDKLFIDDLQIAGLDGNGDRLPYYSITKFDGLGEPSPRANRPDRSRRHGSYDLTTYFSHREFEIDLWVHSEDWDTFWTALDAVKSALAVGSGTQVLTLRRLGWDFTEYAEITLEGGIETRWPHAGTPICQLSFGAVASDPRLYATTLSSINFAATGNASNDGNFNTPPLITFNGAGTNPGLRNDALTTENEINIIYVMTGGDDIEVDCLARTVKLNGTSRPDILDSSSSFFWRLTAGDNSLQKLGGAVSIDIAWHDARI